MTETLLSLDQVMMFFGCKIGKVAILTGIRKNQMEYITADSGEMKVKKESLERAYGITYEEADEDSDSFLTPKEVLYNFFDGSMSETAFYRLLWEGKIPSYKVGAKYVIPKKQLENQFNKLFKR